MATGPVIPEHCRSTQEGEFLITLHSATTSFQSEMLRANFTNASRERYNRMLERFRDHIGNERLVEDLDANDCRNFFDTTFTADHAPSTVALAMTIISRFFKFAVQNDMRESNPMDKVTRPKVPQLRDRKRTRVSSDQVGKMMFACETWSEKMCINTLAYMGVRRTALSNLRWEHVDGKAWTATFFEKGRKRITKPVPLELRRIWTRYGIECGPFDPTDWVVPNRTPLGRTDERSPRVIYNIVKDVSKRCEIDAHVHAFRAAFACQFLRSNPREIEALRQLMGHSSINTTQGYLDEMEGQEAMKSVIDMSFGVAA